MAVLGRLDDLAEEHWLLQDLAKKVRYRYAQVLEYLPESLDPADLDSDHVATHDQLRREVVQAQRTALIDLRNRGTIGDDTLRRFERDLDLEELRTEIQILSANHERTAQAHNGGSSIQIETAGSK